MEIIKMFDKKAPTVLDYLNEQFKGAFDKERYFKNNIESLDYYVDMDKAYSLFDKHFNNNSDFYALQDSDVDGVMASAIILKALCDYGIDGDKIHPLFHETSIVKPHGITDNILNELKECDNKGLLIIPDAGSNDVEYCKELSNDGYDILILDHHNISQNNPYAVVINNQKNKEGSKAGSGALVTFKFIQYLAKKDFKYNIDLTDYYDLVGVSLISDSMSFKSYENRTFLSLLSLKHKNNEISNLVCNLHYGKGYNPLDFTFGIIPYINSVTRVGSIDEKYKVTDYLIQGGNVNYTTEICKLLKNCKSKQLKICRETQKTLKIKQLNNITICLLKEPTSLTGYLANVLLGNCETPIIMVGQVKNKKFCGSIRAKEKVEALNCCKQSGLFDLAEGHQQAFGFIIDISKLKDFDKACSNLTYEKDKVIASYDIDNEAIPEITYSSFANKKMDILWGNDLKEPLFHIHFTCNIKDVKTQGKTQTVLKIKHGGYEFIMFRFSKANYEKYFANKNEFDIDIIGKLEYNTYKGNTKKQIKIISLETR